MPRDVRFVSPPPPHLLLSFSTATSNDPIPPPSIPANIYNAVLHPAVPLTVATLYATTVHALNHFSNGKPYRIAKTRAFHWGIILHNLALAVYSAWTFIGMVGAVSSSFVLNHGFAGFVDSMCKIQDHPVVTSDNVGGLIPGKRLGLWNQGLSFYGWLFYLSKYYEVIDTLIILAKGKKSSTLQTYHHAGAMVSMFVGIKWMSPPIWLFCIFNSLIHTLMYTYYTLSTFRIPVPGILKRSLTSLQITQFIVGGSWAAAYLFTEYRLPGDEEGTWRRCLSNRTEEWAVVINCLYLAPLTHLFVRFFIKSYLQSNKPAMVKAAASAEVAAEEVEKEKGYVSGDKQDNDNESANGVLQQKS